MQERAYNMQFAHRRVSISHLYVLGDEGWISKESFMRIKHQ